MNSKSIRNRNVIYICFILIVLIFAGCNIKSCAPNYQACSIVFNSPANGTVVEPGKEIKISGVVVKGTQTPKTLLVRTEKTLPRGGTEVITIPLTTTNEKSWSFSVTITPEADKKINNLLFEVIDDFNVGNKEKFIVIIGTPIELGTTLNNQVKVILTQSVLNEATTLGGDFINKYKNDAIYGVDSAYGSHDVNSPFKNMKPVLPINIKLQTVGVLDFGTFTIDNNLQSPEFPVNSNLFKGFVNIGEFALKINAQNGNLLTADVDIKPVTMDTNTGKQSLSLYLNGSLLMPQAGGKIGKVFATLSIDRLTFHNATVNLQEKNGEISCILDLTNVNLEIGKTKTKLGLVAIIDGKEEILDFSFGGVFDIMINDPGNPDKQAKLSEVLIREYVLKGFKQSFPLTKSNALAFNFKGIKAAISFVNSSIFTSTDDSMAIDANITPGLDDGFNWLVPELKAFCGTPGDAYPEIPLDNDSNIVVAINNDVINAAALIAFQTGILNSDVTESYKSQFASIGLIVTDNFAASQTFTTPLVFDATAPEAAALPTDLYAGRIWWGNLILEFKNILSQGDIVRISIDTSTAVKLKIGEDGMTIQGYMDKANSTSTIDVLLIHGIVGLNKVVSLIPTLGKEIVNNLLAGSISSLINFKIPIVDVYGSKVKAQIVSSKLENNFLIAKVKVSHQ